MRRVALALALLALAALAPPAPAAAQLSFGVEAGTWRGPWDPWHRPPPGWGPGWERGRGGAWGSYAPPPPPPLGLSCLAGAYACPLSGPAPQGEFCACPTRGGGEVLGRVGP